MFFVEAENSRNRMGSAKRIFGVPDMGIIWDSWGREISAVSFAP